ncbi:hypothetical protein [Evansella tamaricis]|uniref:Uncharacterized protein n=1 Tax=Evansella tamaricis TaxID=2069301 RepID=A0ABS6JIZ2_9BACI|nr:hypothetical protein [Evansella tamaricis]MBU9713635.1 hypothetical protein [Evansella tamaricis]
MKMLSKPQFDLAKNYIINHARPIDRHLFNYHFLNGSKSPILAELEKYQNSDGGVGNALEPDIRSSFSSPVVTSLAMQYARDVNLPWNLPFIRSVMDYFTRIYEKYHHWPLRLPHMNESPHAEWWHYRGLDRPFSHNPGVEIIGYYHAYPQSIPENLLPLFHDHVFQYIEEQPDHIDVHKMLCYLRLVEEMPDPGKTIIIDYLRDISRQVVTEDLSQWSEYSAKPLWLAPSPNSPLYNVLEDVVHWNLDFEIDQQLPDGSWSPLWEWGIEKDFWKNTVLPEWKGWLTVQVLKVLKRYERISFD